MKKFIAALLSAMVGIFGYTITDITVDERIATLEAEVAELRESEGSSGSSGGTDYLEVGDYLKLAQSSNTKFLFRENENGELEYIAPNKVDEIKEDDIFVYVTDIAVQVKDFETVTCSVDCGVNYEPDSISGKVPVLSLSFNGSAPESLAGKQITLDANFIIGESNGLSFLYEEVICMISSDGSFCFNGDLDLTDKLDLDPVTKSVYYLAGKDRVETQLNQRYLSDSNIFKISSPEIS